jgi:GTP-binding protein Era
MFSIMARIKARIDLPKRPLVEPTPEKAMAMEGIKELWVEAPNCPDSIRHLRPRTLPNIITQSPMKSSVISPPGARLTNAVLIGCENSGKSTLMNALLRYKIAAVSPLPQTTQVPSVGARMFDQTQVVLRDTPALCIDDHRRRSVQIWREVDVSDHVMCVVDCRQGINTLLATTLRNRFRFRGKHLHLVLNKVDCVPETKVNSVRNECFALNDKFRSEWKVAARYEQVGELQRLREALSSTQFCKEQPWLYPSDLICPQPISSRITELIREQIFNTVHSTRDVKPWLAYKSQVVLLGWHEMDDAVRIDVRISCPRSQDLGQWKQLAERVRSDSANELKRMLKTQVFLFVEIKVA